MIDYIIIPATYSFKPSGDGRTVVLKGEAKKEFWCIEEHIAVSYQYEFVVFRKELSGEWRIVDWHSIPGLATNISPVYKNQRAKLLDYIRAVDWLGQHANILPQPIFEEIFAEF